MLNQRTFDISSQLNVMKDAVKTLVKSPTSFLMGMVVVILSLMVLLSLL
jgi:hypothetical protein